MCRVMLTLPGSILSGLAIYIVFSALLVPLRITGPISLVISFLVFGLSNYYCRTGDSNQQISKITTEIEIAKSTFNSFFIAAYIILIIFALLSYYNPKIFVHWQEITWSQTIRLAAALLLSFFFPGYALVSTLLKKSELKSLAKLLVAYLFSILITGLTGYLMASLGFATATTIVLFSVINVLLLALFAYAKHSDKELQSPSNFLAGTSIIWNLVKQKTFHNKSEIVVFASLFGLVILSTYYLYNGTIVQDMWFHHGRTYLFTSGVFKDVSRIDDAYPPFQHAFLAVFFALSSIPSINAYVSINFLNIIPVFAFYYFFTNWLPNYKKVALMASTLLMLSSGFGWIYVLNLAATNIASSPSDGFSLLYAAIVKTFDILTPNTFIDVANPTITTGLIIIVLPAGFVLLGMIKESNSTRLRYSLLLAGISLLGYLTQDEFALFGIIASVIPLVLGLTGKSHIFVAIIAALIAYVIFGKFSPGAYYMGYYTGIPFPYDIKGLTVNHELPLFVPLVLFTLFTWFLYKAQLRQKLAYRLNISALANKLGNMAKGTPLLVLAIILFSVVSYMYILSFIVWDLYVPTFNVFLNTDFFSVVPWYFYPLRFGVTGLLGLSFILSYILKRFEREVFVFGLIAIIAFLTGPYYDEMRFSKYIMAAMAGFASLMLFKILSMQKLNLMKSFINGIVIGLVITTSSLSILMYAAYVELGANYLRHHLYNNSQIHYYTLFDSSMPLTYFPSDSEMRVLQFLRNNLNLKAGDNVALPVNEMGYNRGFNWKIVGFVGIPFTKMLQSPLTLQESNLEGLYSLLNYSTAKFILVPKYYMNDQSPSSLVFALDNFNKVYEDGNYLVMSVPPLTPPTTAGNIALLSNQSIADNNNNLTSYYSISALALSKMKYETYASGDLSAFSKKNVVLTFDPVDIKSYLQFARNGGNVFVLDADDDFNGGFSKLMCISPTHRNIRFDSIWGRGQQALNVQGYASSIQASCPNWIIKSYYISNGEGVVPFVIEKVYGNGKIIFVNTSGYFRGLSDSPKFFSSLSNIPRFIGLTEKVEGLSRHVALNAAPFPYFVGTLNMSGPVTINSTSLILQPTTSGSFYTEKISLINKTHDAIRQENSLVNIGDLKNAHVIRDFRIYGSYSVVLNSNSLLYSPSKSTQYSYIPIDVPAGSNMTVELANGSRAEFISGGAVAPIAITGAGSEIEFKGIRNGMLDYTRSSLSILLKYPEINVIGKARFEHLRSNDPADPAKPWGDTIIRPLPIEVKGNTVVKLDHLDYSDQIFNESKGYTTYFNWIKVHTDGTVHHRPPNLPAGELLRISWPDVINSFSNTSLTLMIITIAALSLYFSLHSKKVKKFIGHTD
jgi:Protein of unknown function (DUF1616)